MHNEYYVYEWIRLDTNEPLYVGKGKGLRAYTPYRNKYFNNVLNKLGINNVAVNILIDNITDKEAMEYECWYINLYKYEIGYNLTNLADGGEGSAGYRFTAEQRHKLSLKVKGEKNGMYGKTHTPEVKQRLSSFRKKIQKQNHPFYGKHHSIETKKHWSEIRKGIKFDQERKDQISERVKGEGNPFYNKSHTEESKRKISETKSGIGIKVTAYKDNNCLGEFTSIYEFAKTIGSKALGDSICKGCQALAKGWKPSKKSKLFGYSINTY